MLKEVPAKSRLSSLRASPTRLGAQILLGAESARRGGTTATKAKQRGLGREQAITQMQTGPAPVGVKEKGKKGSDGRRSTGKS